MYKDFFDIKTSIEEGIKAQEKFLKSYESMISATNDHANQTPREVVFEEDKLKLYHYNKSTRSVNKVPTLIVYALVNTPSMMDIGQDKSFIKKTSGQRTRFIFNRVGFPYS